MSFSTLPCNKMVNGTNLTNILDQTAVSNFKLQVTCMQIEIYEHSRETCSLDQVPDAASANIHVNFQFYSCVCSLCRWNGVQVEFNNSQKC